MKFNESQLAAIRAEKNAVILAGAGSGKTTVLAERFLYLVENKGVNIDQVLCLTFTRKAAAEMYERIYSRLQQSDSAQARKQLKSFDRAQISTIDSFCAQVVRNWPEHFGLPEDFLFEDTNELSEEAGLNFILDNYRQPALSLLIDTLGFETVWHELFSSLAEQHLNLAVDYNFSEMFGGQMDVLKKKLASGLDEYEHCCRDILAMEASQKSVTDAQAVLRELPALQPYAEQEAYRELDDLLAGVVLKKPGGKASPVIQILKDHIDQVRTLTSTLAAILDTLAHRDLIRETFLLLEEFRKYYHNIKRSRNRVNFQDAAHMAVVALLKNRQLRRYYKEKYRYIMIDEFQDNNLLQKQLLFLLAEKRGLMLDRIPAPAELEADKLFFVGDDKQSIYRFRGADVSVFKELNRELTETSSAPVSLDTNYRSAPGLITFFNDLFGSLLAGAREKYEAEFQALTPLPVSGLPAPHIIFLYKPYNKPANDREAASAFSNDESEAYAIAGFIHKAVTGGTLPVADKGKIRAAGYNDFTVLMRSTSNQIIYERMFRLFDIPFTSQSVRSLFLEAPVNDFYNLFQLALYPEDRVAYAAYLRSPFAHLSDDTLLAVLMEHKPPFTDPPDLPEKEKIKWEAAEKLYRFVQEEADHCSLCALVSAVWYNSGYRYFILKDSKFHNYLEYYDYLAALAARFDARGETLAGFLDYIRANLGKYEKQDELDILKPEISGVQLLTIHKSKGLEFEIVVLANTGNKGRGTPGRKPYWISEEYGLTLNIGEKNWFQRMAEEENEKKELAEIKRLLYVALTRAKSHLVISGIHNKHNQESEKTHLNLLQKHFTFSRGESPAGEAQYILSSRTITDLDEATYNSHLVPKRKSDPARLKALYDTTPALSREYAQQDFTVQELNEHYLAFTAPGAIVTFPATAADNYLESQVERMQFGTLAHFIIEQHLQNPELPAVIPNRLKIGFPPAQYSEIEQAARQMAANFLSSELGDLACTAEKQESELAFLYRFISPAVTCLIRGSMDLYFETRDRAYVIDFKTDISIDTSRYFLQLVLYGLAAAEMTGKPVSCLLFPLRGRQPVDLTEEIKRAVPAALVEETIISLSRSEKVL